MTTQMGVKTFFERAREKGSEKDRNGIDGTEVKKKLEDATKARYNYAAKLWNQYTQEYGKRLVEDAYDMETLKDFVKKVAYGIEGRDGNPKASYKSVRQVWKDFTAGFRRHNEHIPRNTTLSISNFIKETLLKELSLPLLKRKRRYTTENHFVHLGTQLWRNDWHVYELPGIRVDVWSEIQLYAFTSARVGEYLESASRPGSGRGLYYRDITFGAFQNELGEVEFAAQVVRDAKGMTWTPDKRPEHALHEGLELRPLLLNPILPLLAKCIARSAFRDYSTQDEIFRIPPPPKKEMYALHWKSSMLDTPFFDSLTGEIQKANSFSVRAKNLGRRAGYAKPPTIHDFRAEGLYLIDKLYSTAQRMKYGGQNDEATFRNHYMPNNPGTDGQSSYLGGELRSIVNDLFRGMSLSRNPDLWQSLPAEKRVELETRPEFSALNKELEDLKGKAGSTERERRRLYAQKQRLITKELRQCQNDQPCKAPSGEAEETHLMGHHRARFARVSRLMPERQRLASNMFLVASLRSAEGRSVLHDMIALCRQETEVVSRPGLEADKCRCLMADHDRKPDSKPAAQRWKHIYTCHKKSLEKIHGSAELCFLCDEWILGQVQWGKHCQAHLDNPESLPVQCDPLVYGGTIASAGYCPVCLGNSDLPASRRMYQFLKRDKWKEHVSKCVQDLDRIKAAECPHPIPYCSISFESTQKRRFHIQDVHCVEFTKGKKRCRSDAELDIKTEIDADRTKKPRRPNQPHSDIIDDSAQRMKYEFVKENIKTAKSETVDSAALGAAVRRERRGTVVKRSPISSGGYLSATNPPAHQPHATDHWKRGASASTCTSSEDTCSVTDSATDETVPGPETPASSVYSDFLQNIDPRLRAAQVEVNHAIQPGNGRQG